MIKHIVLAAGGYKGLNILGVLYELSKQKFYDIENIETIYGTSVGSYVGILLCLKIDWEDLLEYFINRPWHKSIKVPLLTDVFSDKGFIDASIFSISLENLLLSKDLSLNTTFQELYNYSKIELHIFTVEVQDFKLIDISYKTHPNMKIIEGIHQSSSIPYIFKPSWYNHNYYIDGGILNNYPLDKCIKGGANIEEILGIKFIKNKVYEIKKITQESNILEFSRHLHNKLIDMCRKYIKNDNNDLKNEINIPTKVPTNIEECLKLIKETESRKEYIEYGKKVASDFLMKDT